jgi:cytochrome P450
VDALPDASAPTIEQALSVGYAARLVKETMRLYPPVWLFGRRAVGEDVLGGFRVPAGTELFICPWLLHRDPRHWSDPETYDPDRFEEAAEERRHRFAYLPFSAGPRHCVGEGFAMAEMAMHLVMAARRFRLKYAAAGPPEAEFHINLRTRRDVPMLVVARD